MAMAARMAACGKLQAAGSGRHKLPQLGSAFAAGYPGRQVTVRSTRTELWIDSLTTVHYITTAAWGPCALQACSFLSPSVQDITTL